MKKFCIFFIMLSLVSVCTTACSKQHKPKPNMIQSKRRFAEFVDGPTVKDPNTIDLSEGPKLKYEGNLGPKNLEFDIKIVDPYKY